MEALPAFLLPQTSPVEPLTPAQRGELAQLRRENDKALYPALFERVLTAMYSGSTLRKAVEECDYLGTDPGAFRRWIHADEKRLTAYKNAAEARSFDWGDRIIEHAAGRVGMETVERDTLIINTYKWHMGADNRKRFGETRQIEQNITVDLSEAMAAAQRRVSEGRGEVIDVQGRTL